MLACKQINDFSCHFWPLYIITTSLPQSSFLKAWKYYCSKWLCQFCGDFFFLTLKHSLQRQHHFLFHLVSLPNYFFSQLWYSLCKTDEQFHLCHFFFLIPDKNRIADKAHQCSHTSPNIPNPFNHAFHEMQAGAHSGTDFFFFLFIFLSAVTTGVSSWIPCAFEKTLGTLCLQGTEQHK